MTKPNPLSAALLTAALLTTSATAQQGQPSSRRLIANARITTTAYGADGQTRLLDRASDLCGLPEPEVWGHWGDYYGPMVVAP